jgi:hypothetical protein
MGPTPVITGHVINIWEDPVKRPTTGVFKLENKCIVPVLFRLHLQFSNFNELVDDSQRHVV